MKRACFLLLVLLSAAFYCCSSRPVILVEAHDPVALLPDSTLGEFSSLEMTYGNSSGSILSLYDKTRHAVIFFGPSGKESSRVLLQLPDSLKRNMHMLYAHAISPDSILVVCSSEMRSMFLFGRSGKIIKPFPAACALADGTNDYVLVAMPESPVVFDGKQFDMTCSRLDVVLRSVEARRKYFSTPPDILLDAQSGKGMNTGCWPGEYAATSDYRDYYPQRCVNAKGTIVFGFGASDTLYEMRDGKIVEKHFCRSRFMTVRHPFPSDSAGHFSFLDRYLVTEPRYRKLIYDPYRNYYYRIVTHAIPYEKQDGVTVNDYLDKPWSLMILNENFEVLDEVKFDPARFLPGVYPVKEGFLVRHRQEVNNKPPLVFSLFRFSE